MDSLNIEEASPHDMLAIFKLAEKLATSFKVKRDCFESSYTSIINSDSSVVLKAESEGNVIGYCLGFIHPAFYANGNVAWVEEIYVNGDMRNLGIGKMLISKFEDWAKDKGCVLCALATRRAAKFYLAIDYEDSATYFKKSL